MQSYVSLYKRLLKAGIYKKIDTEIETITSGMDYDKHHLDCLLNPQEQPPVIRLSKCSCSAEEKTKCEEITVFIGPCIAKKAESREADITQSVDFVLTFEEVKDIFEAAGINPVELGEDLRDHSSKAGRTYAITSGVSEAVKSTLERLSPERDIPLKAQHADGIKACKIMLKDILDGTIISNFIEGMGCVGGCVGGPKALIDREEAKVNVIEYGNKAEYMTPVDNPYVIELLGRLGIKSIQSLLDEDNLFTRRFKTLD